MSPVFADTSFYQSLFSRYDKWHLAASKLFSELDAGIVTTDYIVLELGALMSRGSARRIFVEFIERTRSDPSTEVVPASDELLDGGLTLFASRPDKNWSLTDCISFVVMKRYGLTDALTSDRHFEQAGFRILLHE